MSGTREIQAGGTSARSTLRRAARYAIGSAGTAGIFVSAVALAPAGAQAATAASAKAAPADATAQIQSLLSNPVNGVVNLPTGTFTVSPRLVLNTGERISGHNTTLKVASGSADYNAVLAGATPATNLSGLSITGVTFDQNAVGNPITDVTKLYHGSARFVLLMVSGTNITISGDTFANSDNVNTIVTGSATHGVTISNDRFTNTTDAPLHDHSSIYTSGTGTTISGNTFAGSAAYACAIEVHGSGAAITGNKVSGYYKAANIVASGVTFTGNRVTSAANPVDLWSVAPTATANVTVTGNVLSINRPYWTTVLHNLGRVIPPASITQQVIFDGSSTLPFSSITVSGNTSS
jgi:hypothetical protein